MAPYRPLTGVPASGPESRTNGLGIASLVLGGVALLFAAIPVLNVLGAVGALVGVVLGVVGMLRRGKAKLTAIIGAPLSFLSLALSVLLVITYAVAINAWVDAFDEWVASTEQDGGSYGITEPGPIVFEPGSSEPAGAGLGLSPDNPAPFGSTVRFEMDHGNFRGGWDVIVGSPTLDVTDEVAAAYSGPTLEPGEQYASLPVTVTNRGTFREPPASRLNFEYITSDLQVVEKRWIHIPGAIEAIGGVDPDASAEGDVIIEIPTADADGGVWGVRYFLSSQTVYFGAPAGN